SLSDDGYLREPLETIAATLGAAFAAQPEEILTVLHQIQRFDPVGVGARDLGECLRLQLDTLPEDTPGRALAYRLTDGLLERLPKIGAEGVAS
ncbi:RNA polymerase factor sigma-54, partial [Klebsiella pneumoniae]|nr:RNA polymerase factor sigma-54 [Klebsiella pneumoniae]